jgi:hypothetical protein
LELNILFSILSIPVAIAMESSISTKSSIIPVLELKSPINTIGKSTTLLILMISSVILSKMSS